MAEGPFPPGGPRPAPTPDPAAPAAPLVRVPEDLDGLSLEEARRLLGQLRVQQEQLEKQREQLRRRQEALAAEREKYFIFFRDSTDLMVIADPNGAFLKTNPACSRILGYTEAELTAKPFISFVHPDDRQSTVEEMARQLERGFSLDFENRYLCKDGSIRWLSWHATYNKDEGITCATARDITERKRTEEAIKRSEAHFRGMFENNATVLLLIDPESGAIVGANPAASRYYGYSVETLQQMRIDQINTLSPAEVAVERANAVAGQRTFFIFPHRLASGEVRTVEVSSNPIDLEGRRLLFSIVHDITERKRAERALRESEERMQLSMRAASMGLYDLDLRTGEAIVNAEYAMMLGYDPAEFHETNARWIERLHPDDQGPTAAAFRAYVQGELPEYRVEFRQRTKDGSWKWILSHGKIMERDSEGNPVRMLGMHLDIDVRKRAQEALVRALAEKEVLLKEIHHRVKNNMQIVCSLLNLQANAVSDPQLRGILEESRARVSAMAMIHERLYQSADLARIPFKAYLTSLIEGLAAAFKRKDVRVSVEMADLAIDVNAGIPCGLIVNELVSNAFKYAFPVGKSGSITVGLIKGETGNFVLTVGDDGIGFPGDLDFRSTSSLGLKIVNVLASQLRGTIECLSGPGTTYRIAFPDHGPKNGGPS